MYIDSNALTTLQLNLSISNCITICKWSTQLEVLESILKCICILQCLSLIWLSEHINTFNSHDSIVPHGDDPHSNPSSLISHLGQGENPEGVGSVTDYSWDVGTHRNITQLSSRVVGIHLHFTSLVSWWFWN